MDSKFNWEALTAWLATSVLWSDQPAEPRINTRIYPSTVEATILRGSTGSKRMLATNAGTDAITLEVCIYDMVMNEAGVPMGVTKKVKRGCAAWLMVEPARFTLLSGETKQLSVIARPPTTTLGGYYALISFMEPSLDLDATVKDSEPICTHPIGTAAYLLTVGGGVLAADVRSKGLLLSSRQGAWSSNWSLTARLTNTGNVHCAIVGELALKTSEGVLVGTCPLTAGRGLVLPGMEREFVTEGKGPLEDGEYIAELSFCEFGSATRICERRVLTVTGGIALQVKPQPKRRPGPGRPSR